MLSQIFFVYTVYIWDKGKDADATVKVKRMMLYFETKEDDALLVFTGFWRF